MTTDAQAYAPAWSPDGHSIVFQNIEGSSLANFQADLWLFSLEDNTMKLLIDGETTDEQNAVWSPDSQKLAFERRDVGVTDIWVVNVNGSNPINLTGESSK